MKLIAAVDKNWAIGYENGLLISIPEDMKFFRTTTAGQVVVMGRKTLESFPGGRPLKNRVNIVLTTNQDFKRDGVVTVHSVNELMEELKKYDNEIFVIGGGSIYRLLEPYSDRAYISKIDKSFKADTYFPNLDEKKQWSISDAGAYLKHEDIEYCFTTYKREDVR